MSLFDLFRKRKVPAVTHRVTWFELQVMPFTYRFAIIPEQPILIGMEGETPGSSGVAMLIRYDHAPQVYDKTVERIDALIQRSGILSSPPHRPELAFADQMLQTPGVHLRFSYADNSRWAGVFEPDHLPRNVETFLQDTKTLAREIMREMTHETISGDKALEHIKPELNQAQKDAPQIIARVKVSRTGDIYANKQKVSLTELGWLLDELKNCKGAVWYYRENPNQEPTEAVNTVIKQVLDLVVERKLPIQLQEEEY